MEVKHLYMLVWFQRESGSLSLQRPVSDLLRRKEAAKLAQKKEDRYFIFFESFISVDTFPQGVSPSVHQHSVVEIHLHGKFLLMLEQVALTASKSALFPCFQKNLEQFLNNLLQDHNKNCETF